jgi:hypothetical protein
MTPEKQSKLQGILVFFTVVLLLAGQFILQRTLRDASEQLVSVSTSLTAERRTMASRSSLLDRYNSFSLIAASQGGMGKQFPVNASEFYTALDKVLKDNGVDFTQSNPNQGDTPDGGNFTLAVNFNGPYYNVIKALAALRESQYFMKISDLRIGAAAEGSVTGSMSIVSNAPPKS